MGTRASDWDSRTAVRPEFGRTGLMRSSAARFVAALFFLVLGTLGAGIAYKQFYPEATPEPAPVVVAQPPQPVVEMTTVLVPTRQIERGAKLEAGMFVTVQRPKSTVTASNVAAFTEITGSYAKDLIPAAQPLNRELVTTVRPANAVIEQIPDDMRAVTINVNSTSGVEGWARAGARVDVQWITDLRGERVTTEIVTNAKVLSAERKIDPEADPKLPIPTTVTLLVTPIDANKVALASTGGQLVLHMRGANDSGSDVVDTTGPISKRDLIASARAEQQAGRDVEGVVKLRDPRGGMQEWAIVDGRLYQRERN